jgi:hypothetical protein
VEVAHDAFGVGPGGEPAEVGIARRLERRHVGRVATCGEVEDEP